MKHVVAMEFIVESDEDITPQEALQAAMSRASDFHAHNTPITEARVRSDYQPKGWEDDHPDEEFVPTIVTATVKTVHLLVTNLPEGER